MIWLKDKRIWILLGFYGVLAILFHMCWLKLGGGDDYYFMTCLDDTSFGAFMVKRWYGWSSRLVIEGVLVLVLQQPILVWKVLDILVSVLIAVVRIFLQRLWETWKWQQYPDRQKHFVWDSDGCPAYIPDSVPLPPPFL